MGKPLAAARQAAALATDVRATRRRAWTGAAAAAALSSKPATNPLISSHLPGFDPLKLVKGELAGVQANVRRLLGSGHPALATISKYYFTAEGKHIRPMIVLLMAQAINGLSPEFERLRADADAQAAAAAISPTGTAGIDDPLDRPDVLNDTNPDMVIGPSVPRSSSSSPYILPSQRRLAEISEMIHVASLLHDDVIDNAATRRSSPSAPSQFGNKLSILAGDFLLARASVALSRLGSNEVVELVASVLANLVEGEIMQMKGNTPDATPSGLPLRPSPEIFDHYLRKTYLKTASLIAKSARATAILGGCGRRQGFVGGEALKDMAYSYGRNLGIAFQLVDDMLDFTASASILGKPSDGADLKLGLATAPALFAWEEHPELGELIARKFEREGDVDTARHLISRSSGVERTAELAAEHARQACDALRILPESEERRALESLTQQVLNRKK